MANTNLLERVPSKTKYKIQDLTLKLNKKPTKYRGYVISKVFPNTYIFLINISWKAEIKYYLLKEEINSSTFSVIKEQYQNMSHTAYHCSFHAPQLGFFESFTVRYNFLSDVSFTVFNFLIATFKMFSFLLFLSSAETMLVFPPFQVYCITLYRIEQLYIQHTLHS